MCPKGKGVKLDWTSKGITFHAQWIGPAIFAAVAGVTWSRGILGSGPGGGLEWILDLAAASAGGFLIRYGFRKLRERSMIENVPASHIQSVAMGLAEIKGHAPGAATMTAPLSGTPCHYYRYQVEEERQSGKSGRQWVTIDQGKSNVPFHVEDPTGRILVNPEGADILLQRSYQKLERGEGWFGRRRRYREWRIDPAEFVYVLGTVSKMRDRVDERRALLTERLRQAKKDPSALKRFDLDGSGTLDEQEWAGAVAVVKDDLLREDLGRKADEPPDDLVIGAGELESTFLISDRDERSVASSLGWKALGAVMGGGACVLVMTVSILGRFGIRPGGWTFPWESLLK